MATLEVFYHLLKIVQYTGTVWTCRYGTSPNESIKKSVLRIRNVLFPGSRIQIFSIANQTIVSKLSGLWSGKFIPDPDPGSDLDFLTIPDPVSRVKKAPEPGSVSATLVLRHPPPPAPTACELQTGQCCRRTRPQRPAESGRVETTAATVWWTLTPCAGPLAESPTAAWRNGPQHPDKQA